MQLRERGDQKVLTFAGAAPVGLADHRAGAADDDRTFEAQFSSHGTAVVLRRIEAREIHAVVGDEDPRR